MHVPDGATPIFPTGIFHTNTAIGQFTVKAEDQRTGKPVNRRVAVIAISVWYEEPAETG